MKKLLRAILVVAAITIASFVGLVGYYYFVIFGNADQTLAKNLEVTTEWREVQISPPVSPVYDHQAIYLRPVAYVFDRDSKGSDIRLPDGTVVRPQIELYDDSGDAIAMSHIAFTLGHKGADYVDFSGPYELPEGRTYTKFRIRSNVPFVCERIEWIDYSPP